MENKSSNQISESTPESAKPSPSPQPDAAIKNDSINGINVITKIGPKILAIGLGVAYISGFLVFNAYLNRFGITEFDIVNSRYLIPGAIFIFYLVCFYLFAGRNIVLVKKWMGDDIKQLLGTGAHPFWGFIAFIHSYVHFAFFLCISSALFSSIAFSQSETYMFYGVLMIAFIFSYSFDITNLDVRYPKVNLIFQFIFKIPAVFVFFYFQETTKLTLLFFSYFTIAIYINFVLDHLERYKLTADRLGFSAMHAVIVILVYAVLFGSIFYGDISRKIGGGEAISTSIGLSENLTKFLSSDLEIKGNIIEADILFISNNHIFIETNGKTFRISEKDIEWFEVHRPKSKVYPSIIKRAHEEKKQQKAPAKDLETISSPNKS
jgi:hypothetical protein